MHEVNHPTTQHIRNLAWVVVLWALSFNLGIQACDRSRGRNAARIVDNFILVDMRTFCRGSR